MTPADIYWDGIMVLVCYRLVTGMVLALRPDWFQMFPWWLLHRGSADSSGSVRTSCWTCWQNSGGSGSSFTDFLQQEARTGGSFSASSLPSSSIKTLHYHLSKWAGPPPVAPADWPQHTWLFSAGLKTGWIIMVCQQSCFILYLLLNSLMFINNNNKLMQSAGFA